MTSLVTQKYGITLRDNGSPVGLALSSMVLPALRRNPRRAQLLVSTVLGKHVPVDPRVVAGVGRLLGALISMTLDDRPGLPPEIWSTAASATVTGDDPGALLAMLQRHPVTDHGDLLTIGFAETATALGHLVAEQLGSAYLHSTRNRAGGIPVAAEFSEPHSHATGHLLRPASPDLLTAGTVVLVDDELSTGRTALNVIEVLHAIRPGRRYVLAGLVDVRSADADAQRAAVADRLGCRIDVVSLVRGTVAVPADAAERIAADLGSVEPPSAHEVRHAGVVTPATGSADGSVLSLHWPVDVPKGGGHGFRSDQHAAFAAAATGIGHRVEADIGGAERLLVIGTEEFMYLPLQLALALSSREGRSVAYQSTTRSPVHAIDEPGYPIRRRIDFRSSRDGGPRTDARYLYNADWPGVADSEPDVVLIVHDGSEITTPAGVAGAVGVAIGARVVLAAVGADVRG